MGGGGGFGNGGGFSDLFEMMNGGKKKRQGPQKTETAKYPLYATIEDFYNGGERKVRICRSRNCKPCGGKGSTNSDAVKTCSKCKGRGIVQGYRQVGPGFVQQVQTPCPDCAGEGKVIPDSAKCTVCKGLKFSQETKVISIFIEKGMKEGQKISLENEGDEKPGILAGDIIFVLQQKPHKTYQRDETTSL